uniref:hypothetical protein n=1 Tax=Haemophilus parahaemolyticus TaxID=735 RepID=UPI001C6A51F4|nr:hypothetical protein [Haemophilus parahaemolyticus]
MYLLKIQAPKIKVAVLAINESIVQNQLELRQIDFALVTPDFQAPNIHAKIGMMSAIFVLCATITQ